MSSSSKSPRNNKEVSFRGRTGEFGGVPHLQ
jgi:hypothetical protein